MKNILIIEDEVQIRDSLTKLLERNQYDSTAVESVEDALKLKNLKQFDLILSDIRLPGVSGTEIIKLANPIPVVIMTSFADIDSAVNAMKLGAVDYISKPFKYPSLLEIIENNLISDKAELDINNDNDKTINIIGNSKLMLKMFDQINKVAKTDSVVIITGESGTGKELVARSIHQKSLLSSSTFITFNCASKSIDDLEVIIEDINASFTLYLDGVTELSIVNQGKLLSLLNTLKNSKTNSYRIIASTSKDLQSLEFDVEFRKDLYFRLSMFKITPPPLREREDDIAVLAVHLMNKACVKLSIGPYKLSKDAFNAIRKYSWPGNIRELSNCIHRAVLMSDSATITPNLLDIDYDVELQSFSNTPVKKMSLDEYFRSFVIENQNQMTETELAKQLGMSRKTLWERRQKFGINKA